MKKIIESTNGKPTTAPPIDGYAGLCPVLFTYITTHDAYSTGYGRKIHISNGCGKSLCGYSNLYYPSLQVTKEWLEQPDPDNELCQKCKKSALRLFK